MSESYDFDRAELTLSSEWVTFPLWLSLDGEFYGEFSFDEIRDVVALDPGLLQEIKDWDRKFQDTYDPCYPPDGGFATQEEDDNFVAEGRELAYKLRSQCPDNFTVFYCGNSAVWERIEATRLRFPSRISL